ncbi:MAG: hypothetical protein LBD24_01630 [Spirochaetaceae bacterium]|nr:hypothetical protein [Spirochaetaceae bacterium]
MHYSETTGGHARTAGGCRAQQRAYCKPPAATRSVAAPDPYKPPNRTRCCTTLKQQAAMLKPSETGRRLGGLLFGGNVP